MPTSPDIQMQLAVLNSAYVTLARHLAVRGHADIQALAADLECMADTQDNSTWREEHMRLAGVLRVLS